jgi:hypothetical protein
MKKMKSIYALVAGTLLLASCADNEHPKFNDADAFAAFTKSAMSVNENVQSGELKIPVLFTSLAGLNKSVDFEIVDGTAAQGVNFEVTNASNTLSFTKEAPEQYITIKVNDNDTFGGDISFSINLKESGDINLGASKTCTVTIVDDEHPLAFILGTFTGNGESYFNGATQWTLSLEKDADDVSKVWISNMVPEGTSLKVYGVVNDEKTEIRIPVGQEIAQSSAYSSITLEGFVGAEGEESIPTGGNIIGTIAADGTITIEDWFGSYIPEEGLWFNIMIGAVWTKQ